MKVDVLHSAEELLKLAQRFDNGQGFRRYVKERLALVAPLALLMLATAIVFASALIVFAGPHIWLALPAMILAPFVLVGSLLVQAFLYFSWLENRAMAKALGHAVGSPGSCTPSPPAGRCPTAAPGTRTPTAGNGPPSSARPRPG